QCFHGVLPYEGEYKGERAGLSPFFRRSGSNSLQFQAKFADLDSEATRLSMKDTSVHSQRPNKAFYKLKHLLPGALAMAGTAGYVNSVVLGFFHSPVSHMTGAVSRLGLDIAE